MSRMDGDGFFQFVGGAIVLTFTVAFMVGKLAVVVVKGIVTCIGEEMDEREKASLVKAMRANIEASDLPFVSPWMESGKHKFKLLGTLDVTADDKVNGNAIVLHTSPQSADGSRKYHLEPVTAFNSAISLDGRMSYLSRDSCFHLRVFAKDGRIASFYAAGTPLIFDNIDTQPVLYCADTVHALLVDLLWPGAAMEYHIGPVYNINIPEARQLSSPPTPQELEMHGLRITTKDDRDFGRPPVIQSCWTCVCYRSYPRRGVHAVSGTRWCLHAPENYFLPDQLFEHRLSAVITPYFATFFTDKGYVDKNRKTYQLVVQVGRTIEIPPSPPVQNADPTRFSTSFITTPVSPANVRFMSRGGHPKSAADVRWETIMSGEPCLHASSTSLPVILEEVAPDGAAFLVSLDFLQEMAQGRGLIPIVGIPGMDSVESTALSLTIADLGYWVYWKNRNQCLGCAVSLVRERFRRGTAVVFAF